MSTINLEFDHFFSRPSDKSFIRKQIDFKRGVYFWFCDENALTSLKIPISKKLHSFELDGQTHYLLYIGIGPRNEFVKTQFLKDRLTKCHLGKRINQSTLRQSISALLGYHAYKKVVGKKGKKKVFIEKDDEYSLSKFMVEHFSIGIIRNEEPWEVEDELITQYSPPINLDGNQSGWYFPCMSYARTLQLKNAPFRK